MKQACAGRVILGGLLGWLTCLAVPAGWLAAMAPRAAQVGARGPGTGSTPAAASSGSPALAAPGDQATTSSAVPQPGAVWFLSPAQERQLKRIGQAARRWHAALPPLAAAARQQGDSYLQGELVKLGSLLRQLESGQMTFAAYVAALAARNQALALWAANSSYVGPGEAQAWQQADAGAAELATAAETGFVFGADLSTGSVVTYVESAQGDKRGAAGDDGVSAGHESGGSGTGDAASGEPASETDGPMADGPAVPASGPGYGDPVQEGAGATPGAAGSGDAGLMPGASTTAPLVSSGGAAGEAPVPEVDSGVPRPATTMASLGSGGGAPGWVVIHGGPVVGQADGQPADAPPAGDMQEQLPPLILRELGAGDEGDTDVEAAAAASPLAWEEICRPWNLGAIHPALCPLQPAGADKL